MDFYGCLFNWEKNGKKELVTYFPRKEYSVASAVSGVQVLFLYLSSSGLRGGYTQRQTCSWRWSWREISQSSSPPTWIRTTPFSAPRSLDKWRLWTKMCPDPNCEGPARRPLPVPCSAHSLRTSLWALCSLFVAVLSETPGSEQAKYSVNKQEVSEC